MHYSLHYKMQTFCTTGESIDAIRRCIEWISRLGFWRITGAIQCKVQASNLTDTVKALLPVTYRRATVSVLEFANDLVRSRLPMPKSGQH